MARRTTLDAAFKAIAVEYPHLATPLPARRLAGDRPVGHGR
jgi:hypothetical protein